MTFETEAPKIRASRPNQWLNPVAMGPRNQPLSADERGRCTFVYGYVLSCLEPWASRCV